jgi:hypothetical protein
VGPPFLEGKKVRERRSYTISIEVRDYLREMERVMPFYEMGNILPADTPKPPLPEEPECLIELGIYERWGFPYPGGWLSQPFHWLEDVYAAQIGRDMYQREKSKADTQAQLMEAVPEGLPDLGAIVSRG